MWYKEVIGRSKYLQNGGAESVSIAKAGIVQQDGTDGAGGH